MIYENIIKLSSAQLRRRYPGAQVIYTSSIILIRTLYEYDHSSQEDNYDQNNKNELYKLISNILVKSEPAMTLGPNWHYLFICNSFALIKHKQHLWDMFSDSEKNRMDQLMKMFAYNWNLGCNTNNNYGTGVDLKGNYGKWRGPNYRLCNIGLIFALVSYFGSISELDNLFLNYDYDAVMQENSKLNFHNICKTWSTETKYSEDGKKILGAKDLTMYGGTAYIQQPVYDRTWINTLWRGEGKGVRIPYEFKDNYPYGIIHFLYNNCFDGGKVISSLQTTDKNVVAHISDNTTSPFEGLDGMMLEFNMADDGRGTRSSLFYCTIDFMLVLCMAATLEKLNISKLKDYKNFKKVWVGMEDYIYKKEHGYVGYKLGYTDKSNFNNNLIVNWWVDYWKQNYRPLTSAEEIK